MPSAHPDPRSLKPASTLPGTSVLALLPEGRDHALLLPYVPWGRAGHSVTACCNTGEPDRKIGITKHRLIIHFAKGVSLHSTTPIPAPVHSRPHSAHRKLICLAFPEHAFGEDAAVSQCLLRFSPSGRHPAPISVCPRPACLPRQPARALGCGPCSTWC